MTKWEGSRRLTFVIVELSVIVLFRTLVIVDVSVYTISMRL